MRSIGAPFLKKVINNEMNSLKENKNGLLNYLPPVGCKSIGCKWIFRKTLRIDESIDKLNVRLVIGCQQVGVDFFDRYSYISKVTTIRISITLDCIFNLEIHQMNVKNIIFK